MTWTTFAKPIVIVSFGWVIGWAGLARGESVQDKYHHAYFLENEKHDSEAAAKLYEEVVAGAGSDAQLRADAESRLRGCREELASADFAKLMPAYTLAYVEINKPGEQLRRLLDQLGLLATNGNAAKSAAGPRVAISPALIDGLIGLRGGAAALTGFDPLKQMPSGVVIFHPGNLEVVRGLIETGLPIGAKESDKIEGFATYQIENQVYVTLTSRLVVASPDKAQIQGVIKRLNGSDKTSLATAEGMTEALAGRADAMFFATVNAKAVVPIIKGMAVVSGADAREMAMAQAVIDLNSLRTLSARAGVTPDGLNLDIMLQLDKGHHSLAFNFLRTPPVNPETLKRIPNGVAGFVVGALNEPSSRFSSTKPDKAGAPTPITALDFGREVFANINSFAIYALPPEGESAGSAGPVPDVAALFNVNDPAKSEALWTQVLGLVSLATGAPTAEGTREKIEETDVRLFTLPEGHSVYFAAADNDVYVAATKSAMQRSLAARRTGKGILDDPTFAQAMNRMKSDSVKGVFIHPGRCAQIAKRFMQPSEVAEMEPVVNVLTDTVASITVDHSDQVLRMNVRVDGLPKINGLVSALIAKEQAEEGQKHEARMATRRSPVGDREARAASKDSAPNAGDRKALQAKFRELAESKEKEAAVAVGQRYVETIDNKPEALNLFAWTLLTDKPYAGQFAELALRASQRANEQTEFKNWAFLDTLALAKFENGDVGGAVELEKKAIELSKGAGQPDLNKALARFEAAMRDPAKAAPRSQ